MAQTAAVSGRLAARRQAKENYQNYGGDDRKGNRFYMDLRLRPEDLAIPTRIHLLRPAEAYVDPSNPELNYWWKTGMGYFVKTKKFPKGMFFEKNFDEDLIEAYSHPKEYKLEAVEGVSEGKWLAKFQPKPYYCVSGLIEEWFHLVQYQDDSRQRDGKPVTWIKRERCIGKNCENCRDKWPKVFGNRFWMDFTYPQWFGPIDSVFEKLDRTPKDGGYVYPLHYACAGCEEVLRFTDSKDKREVRLDMMNACSSCGSTNVGIDTEEHYGECNDCDVRWSLLSHEDPKLNYYLATKLKCLGCGHEDYPNPVMVHSENLTEWETNDIFDLQMTIHMVEDGKKRKLEVKSFKVQEPDKRCFDATLQGEGEAATKVAERHKEPLDLNKVHRTLSADEQAEMLELSNLFDPQREARANRKRTRWQDRHQEKNGEAAAGEAEATGEENADGESGSDEG